MAGFLFNTEDWIYTPSAMSSRVLLINFTKNEQARISKLGLEVDLGYLSDASDIAGRWDHEAPEQTAKIYTPLAPYEYKVIFARLTKNPPLEHELEPHARVISERDKVNLHSYWHDGRGILVVLSDESNYSDLSLIGITGASLESSSQNDRTIDTYGDDQTEEIKKAFTELCAGIRTPVAKYVRVTDRKSEYNARHWTIYSPYTNRNDDDVGIYLNWGYDYEHKENPAFLILPTFKENAIAVERILRALATWSPTFLPEITASSWLERDELFPDAITSIENEIMLITAEHESKINSLKDRRKELKNKYEYLKELLTESGDSLKDAVATTLREIFLLKVTDLDKESEGQLNEDLLIEDTSADRSVFAEVKGTRNPTPTLNYIVQLQRNLLKRGLSTGGMLILNHDLTRAPENRTDAYAHGDESEALQGISFLDTRVLHRLALAIINGKTTADAARNILFNGGRIK